MKYGKAIVLATADEKGWLIAFKHYPRIYIWQGLTFTNLSNPDGDETKAGDIISDISGWDIHPASFDEIKDIFGTEFDD